jgi:hypothetical protein
MAKSIVYGTTIRLQHRDSGRFLKSVRRFYSHSKGSWQQIVGADDDISEATFWRIKGPDGTPVNYRLGKVVRNGDIIRLEHVATQKNLHSHSAKAPITGQQEVTAFQEPTKSIGEGDGNDNWRVVIGGGNVWKYNSSIRLAFGHPATYLTSTGGMIDPVLTAGLHEVSTDGPTTLSLWQAEPVPREAASGPKGDVRIFISHSFKDQSLAAALVQLLHAAFKLRKSEIRCSSVPGYKFSIGVAINAQIKFEVEHAQVFVALVTPFSLGSPYVLFEMGARWGRDLFFATLVAKGATKGFLKTPVAELLALSATDGDDLCMFLGELASKLNQRLRSTGKYDRALKKFRRLARKPKSK